MRMSPLMVYTESEDDMPDMVFSDSESSEKTGDDGSLDSPGIASKMEGGGNPQVRARKRRRRNPNPRGSARNVIQDLQPDPTGFNGDEVEDVEVEDVTG